MNVEGVVFSAPQKQRLMEGLAVAIQNRDISFPADPPALVNELESFEYRYRRTGVSYSAPEGEHDDCVDALALAVSGLQKARGSRISGDLASPGEMAVY